MTGQIAGYNTGDIASGLQSLGLAAGDTAFVHYSSWRSGRVEGGPETVVAAFLDVLGKEGTLAMPNSAASSPRETIRSGAATARRR